MSVTVGELIEKLKDKDPNLLVAINIDLEDFSVERDSFELSVYDDWLILEG